MRYLLVTVIALLGPPDETPALRASALLDAAPAARPVGTHLNFVACPVVRDTPTPCWLTVYRGELYYLGPQGDLVSSEKSDFYPPQLNHQALIEGIVSDAPRVCGGVVLKPVRASVLPEVDRSCNTILPPEGYSGPIGARGNGPTGKLGDAAPGIPRDPPLPPAPEPPFEDQYFRLEFDFASDRLLKKAQLQLWRIALYAKTAGSQSIDVVGHWGAVHLDDGTDLAEEAGLARRRADIVTRALKRLGVSDATRLNISELGPADGEFGADTRQVIVRLHL